VPFLVYDEKPEGEKEIRCTSCGICAKVCPPQCIWIVRTNDPQTGRPIPEPAEFFIDADICMNCGFCAEYCPFDAIIMDHDYEIASYERNVFDMQKLLKPAYYYKSIRRSTISAMSRSAGCSPPRLRRLKQLPVHEPHRRHHHNMSASNK
jgi:NADH-quinone oxidoreductase subunit I